MPFLELILATAPMSPAIKAEELSLFFELCETQIAKKFFDAVKECEEKKSRVYEPDRIYNFPGDPRDRNWISDQLNLAVDTINTYSPGLIKHRAKPVMDQKLMNDLHHYFELYRGPILSPPKFFTDAPWNVKKALEDFNILIHRYEDYCRNEQYVASGRGPAAKAVVTFEGRKRYELADEDYLYFSKRVVFGRWYVNYCES
jgi:hypothetical protein